MGATLRSSIRAGGRPAIGLAVLLAGIAVTVPAGPPYRDTGALGLLFVVGSALLLIWRKAAPVAVTTATGLVVVANAAVGHDVTLVQWPAWIALFTCFSVRGGRARVAATAAVAGSVAGYAVLDRNPVGPVELSAVLLFFLLMTVGGEAVRSRQARIVAEAHERVLMVEHAMFTERTRLARELHDALGHAVNVMVMQAGVGRRIYDDNPDFGREALCHIETLGRDALDELDRLLQVLDPREPPPAPLDDLAARVRAAGRELDLTAPDLGLPVATARTVNRIVQEAVTNALRHSADGPIRVALTREGDRVVVEVANQARDLPAAVPGRGLANMRERAHQAGGHLDAGPFPGGFRVRASLPSPAAGVS